jgi:alpha-1,6-mannosyltransferase
VIGWMLYRVVPWTPAPGLDKDANMQRDPLTVALRTALVLSVAWLITSMYTLSWYDLLAWMPLAVLAATKLDKIMVIRGTALSMAYVPGRAIDMGEALDFTATRMRDTVSPIIQMAMILAVILWWRQPDRPELFPFKKPKAPPATSSPTVSGPAATPRETAPQRSSPPKAARSQVPIPVRELASRRKS